MADLLTDLAATALHRTDRQQLLALVNQAGELRSRGVLTLPEHDQLRAILLAALGRLDVRPARRARAEGDILDAVEVDADPNAPDVLDAVDLFFEDEAEEDEVLDALAVGGDVDGADVLDALHLPDDEPAEDILDAVDLGDVDGSDALDADPLDGFADEMPLDMAEELDVSGFAQEADRLDAALNDAGAEIGLDFGGDVGGTEGGDLGFNFGGDTSA
jgi:hypothetical protein